MLGLGLFGKGANGLALLSDPADLREDQRHAAHDEDKQHDEGGNQGVESAM